jgi:hypothetical protein
MQPYPSNHKSSLNGNAVNSHFNSDYYILPHSPATDTIGEHYLIKYNQPISYLSGPFAKAYELEHTNNFSTQDLYALVFDRKLPIRLWVINYLKKTSIENFAIPIHAEIVRIGATNSQHVAVVLKKPPLTTLREYLAKYGACTPNFIIENVLKPLTDVLSNLDEASLAHGRINVDNVYINGANYHICLGECISEPAGFSQQEKYETVSRAQCVPIGKGESDNSIDYFALGVLCLHLFTGQEPSIDKDSSLLEMRLNRGTSNLYLKGLQIPYSFKTLLKGLLNDTPQLIWRSDRIKEWCSGKTASNQSDFELTDTSPLVFLGTAYYNTQALAYALNKSWEKGKKFIKETKSLQWLERKGEDKNSYDLLVQLFKNPHGNKNSMDTDEFLAKTLCIINPSGPIRLKELAFTLEGVGTLLAYGYNYQQPQYLSIAIKFLNYVLWHYSIEYYGKQEKKFCYNFNLLALFENAKNYQRRQTFGFGLERVFYELNPHFCCQSNNLGSEYISSLPDLLTCLDQHASTSKEAVIIDNHIAAFISNRLSLDKDIFSGEHYKNNPYCHHRTIQGLILLFTAQKETGHTSLYHLCQLMANQVTELLNADLNSTTIKKELVLNLEEAAKTGQLLNILSIALDTEYRRRDKEGLSIAKKKYKEIEALLSNLNDHQTLLERSYKSGLKLAVATAYIVCSLVFIWFALSYR